MDLNVFYSNIIGIEQPWVVESVDLSSSDKSVHLHLGHPALARFACSECGCASPVYDHGEARVWRHLDTCDHYTYLHASLPRTNCKTCGVHSVVPSWSRPNSRFTLHFECYALDVLYQTQVVSRSAELLRITVDQMRYMRDQAVERGLNLRKSNGGRKVIHLCIDEKSLFKGQHYVTIFYDGQTGAVLEVVEHRTKASTTLGIKELGQYIPLSDIQVVTMDMWEAFKTVTAEYIPQAAIVHDRFHLAQYLNKAVDTTRKAENKKLVKQEDERLKKTKYIWLKNPENLSLKQAKLLEELIKDDNLKTAQAWQLKENFKQFFDQKTLEETRTFFEQWKQEVSLTKNNALIKVSDMFEKHLDRLLTYAKHRVTNAMAECQNASIQLIKAKARGFKSAKAFRKAILFFCGQLHLYP